MVKFNLSSPASQVKKERSAARSDDDQFGFFIESFTGGSRGFLLVLKNYPFSELKTYFCCSLALETGSDSE